MEKNNIAPTIAEPKKVLYYPTNVEDTKSLVSEQITKLCEMRIEIMTLINTIPPKQLDFMKDEIFENWDMVRANLYESMNALMTIFCCLEEVRISQNICAEPFKKEVSHE